LPVLVGTLLIALAGIGCGDSADAGPLTKSQFLLQADSICRTAEEEREEALKEAAEQEDTGSGSEAEYFVSEVALPPIESMNEDLGDLVPPRGDEKEVEAIIAAFEQGIGRIEADPTDLTIAVSAFTKANQLSEAYGLKDCTI